MNNNTEVRDEFTLSSKKFQFLRLMGYFKPFLPHLAVSILLAVLVNASVLIKPFIIKHVIDDYLIGGSYDPSAVRLLGISFFAVIVAGAALGYSQTYLLTYIGQRIMYNIRGQLFKHIQGMSMGYFDRHSSGRILTRITNDVEALNEMFSGVIINIFRDAIMIAGIVIMMFSMNAKLALVSISSIPIIAVITVIYRVAARKNFIKMKGMIARINGFLAENISGMKLVQIFHREKEKFDELSGLDGEYFSYSLREVILNSLCRPIVDIINTLTIALLIWFSSGAVIDTTLQLGVLYAFITYIKQIFEPISEISEKYTTIQSAIVSSERIFEILDTEDCQENMTEGAATGRLMGEIEFRNVWFAYVENNWVLKDVSFSIKPGETAAFVGATGSGKSTIINLIGRFYDIQKGQILIDGRDIREYRLHDLRRQISVVLQDVFLFSGDIKSNIRLNNRSISDADIVGAAKYMKADEFIESLPGKYDEIVRERGCTFSAGQRQLISFVRAVAFQPSILVLDEATANIDTETEMLIQKSVMRVAEGRTAIVIAHRLSTIRHANKIIVIHKGRIKEMGRHEELMQRGGIYSQLYKKSSAVSPA